MQSKNMELEISIYCSCSPKFSWATIWILICSNRNEHLFRLAELIFPCSIWAASSSGWKLVLHVIAVSNMIDRWHCTQTPSADCRCQTWCNRIKMQLVRIQKYHAEGLSRSLHYSPSNWGEDAKLNNLWCGDLPASCCVHWGHQRRSPCFLLWFAELAPVFFKLNLIYKCIGILWFIYCCE